MNRHRKRRSGGFTLIEVLLVLTILVVLASLVVVAIGPVMRGMHVNSAKAQIGMLEEAIRTYQVSVGELPPDLNALVTCPAIPDPTKWNGPYLTKGLPITPWGGQYQYNPTTSHGIEFDVWCVTNEGQEIGNW
jgi:general secretion pathway protein G